MNDSNFLGGQSSRDAGRGASPQEEKQAKAGTAPVSRYPRRKQPRNIGLTANQVLEAVRKHRGKKPAARALGVTLSTVRYWFDRSDP